MQKKILAAVVASMMAGQAMAVTIVDDGTNKATIGGYMDLRYKDQGSDESTSGGDSRINFGFEHKMTETTTAFAKAEWAFNALNDQDENGQDQEVFKNRLGYVGVANELYGSVSFGKQWSSYGMVAGYTDMFAAAPNGGMASGYYNGEAEALGTSRADDALQYNHSIMGLNISAQTQLGDQRVVDTNITRKNSYGIAASYDLPMGLSIGAGYNQADVEAATDYKAKSAVMGVKFEADKLYAAFTYSDLKNVKEDIHGQEANDAKGYELYASYQLNEMFKVEGGYVQLKGEDVDGKDLTSKMKSFPMAVVYTQGPVQLSGTYQFEKSKDSLGNDVDDTVVLQARYYF